MKHFTGAVFYYKIILIFISGKSATIILHKHWLLTGASIEAHDNFYLNTFCNVQSIQENIPVLIQRS